MASDLLDRYLKDGYVHVPGVFGAREVEDAVRRVGGVPAWIRGLLADPDVQRYQPLQSCPVSGDPAWIDAFYDSPALDRLLDELFGACIRPAPRMSRDPKITGLLIDPSRRWWSTGLHRDYRDFIPDLDVGAWKDLTGDLRLFNQVNAPLLPDPCLWVVPGSHARDDLPVEARFVAARARYADCRFRDAGPDEIAELEAELLEGLRACGAVNVAGAPGDVVIYRSNMLHCGVYGPGPARLTLHDGVYSKEWHDYVARNFGDPAGVGTAGGRSARTAA